MGRCLTNIIPVFLPEDGINIPLVKETIIFELGMFLSQRSVCSFLTEYPDSVRNDERVCLFRFVFFQVFIKEFFHGPVEFETVFFVVESMTFIFFYHIIDLYSLLF